MLAYKYMLAVGVMRKGASGAGRGWCERKRGALCWKRQSVEHRVDKKITEGIMISLFPFDKVFIVFNLNMFDSVAARMRSSLSLHFLSLLPAHLRPWGPYDDV